MWRLFRRRSPLPSPLASSVAAGQVQGGQVVMVQRVKIKRRKHRFRNFAIGFTAVYICMGVYDAVVLKPLARAMDENEMEMPEEESKKDDLFIPVPFSIKAVQSRPFRYSDPEWQAFVEINNDPAMIKKIRRDLIGMVHTAVRNNSMLGQRAGQGGWKVGRFWLDFDYPYGPPPKFLQSGFELREDELVLTRREIDPATALRIRRMMWPSPMAQSTFLLCTDYLRHQFRSLVQLAGYDQASDPPQKDSNQLDAMKKAVGKLSQPSSKDPDTVKDPRAMAASSQEREGGIRAPRSAASSSGATNMESPADKSVAKTQKPTGPPSQAAGSSEPTQANTRWPQLPTFTSPVGAWDNFKKTLAQKRGVVLEPLPSGCIRVSGLVQLESQAHTVVIDVTGFWDPKTRKYDSRSLYMRMRRLTPKIQKPLVR